MSDRPVDINLTSKVVNKVEGDDLIERFSKVSIDEARRRIARVFDRARTVDRLHVELPAGVYGEWVSNDAVSIHSKEMLGFEIDTRYAIDRKLNDVGDGKAVIGDVVFMVCPQVIKDALDEERVRRYHEAHLKKRQHEEREFEANTKQIGLRDVTIDSNASAVRGDEIVEALTPQER